MNIIRKSVILLILILFPHFAYAQEFSFDDQFVSSEEYTKIVTRLHDIELKLENLEDEQNNDFWAPVIENIEIIAGLATAGALTFLGYQTMMLRSERNMTLRAWVGEARPYMGHEAYINAHGNEKTPQQWKQMSEHEKNAFNVTRIRRFVEMKNFGRTPATSLRARTKLFVNQKPSRKDIESVSYSSSHTLMPNGTVNLFSFFTKEEELATKDPTKECFFILELEYKSQNSRKTRKFGTLSQLSETVYGNIESWDEN